ncbi:MAG: lipopolysaccharide biosynthesis protein [Promethearchaeota archaeon]
MKLIKNKKILFFKGLNKKKINNSNLFKLTIKYFLARGLPGVINFFALLLFTRILSPKEYGVYAYIISIVGLVDSFVFQWIRTTLIRFIHSFRKKEKLLTTNINFIFIILSFITTCLILIFYKFIGQDYQKYCFLIITLIISRSWFEIYLAKKRAILEPKKYGIAAITKAVIFIFFSWVFVKLDYGVNGVLFGLLISLLIPTIIFDFKENYYFKFQYLKHYVLKDLFNYGFPLTIAATLRYILSSSDRLMIRYFLGEQELGKYAVTYDLAQQILVTIFMLIEYSATPLLFKVFEEKGIKKAIEQYLKNGKFFLQLTTPLFLFLIIFRDFLIKILIGKEFQNTAIQIFPYIIMGIFLHGIRTYFVDSFLYLIKKTSLLLYTIIPAAILNVFSNIFFIPKYGIKGAAITTIMSYALALIFSLTIVNKFNNC